MPAPYSSAAAPAADVAETVEYVHPVSARVLSAVPFLEQIPVLGLAIKNYHPKLITAICVQRLLEYGLANGLMRLSIQPMLTDRYGLTGAMYQRFSTLYSLGWAINAFVTVMADTFALFGYTKRWYSVLSAVGGGVFALLYALLPAKESSAKPAAAFMFLTALFMSNIDVFAVALYSVHIRRRPKAGPALVSWMFVTKLTGTMISSVIQGPLSDNGLTQVGIYITIGILLVVGSLFVVNFFEERRNRDARLEDAKIEFLQHSKSTCSDSTTGAAPGKGKDAQLVTRGDMDVADDEEEQALDARGFVRPRVDVYLCGAIEFNRDAIMRNWRMALFCLILTMGVIVNALVNILGTRWHIMYSCIAVTVAVCASSFFTLPLTIAKVVVFMYGNTILYLNLPGVLNTFYVAQPSCLPDGPHFTYTFYNTMNGVLGHIASMAGAALFTHMCPNRSYRFVMSLSGILLPAASIFDLIILKRWNIAIGIPDHAMYVFGDAIIYHVCRMLLNMPTTLLMCRIAPRGCESMVFALLASIYHLGSSTSSAIGYLLMDTIWPVVTKGTCDYSNAQWLVITGHLVTPVLICPLAFLLLPSARISDNIDHRGRRVATVEVPDTESERSEPVCERSRQRGETAPLP